VSAVAGCSRASRRHSSSHERSTRRAEPLSSRAAGLTSLAAGTWRIILVTLLMIPGKRPCAMRRLKAASSSVDAAVMPTVYGHMHMCMYMLAPSKKVGLSLGHGPPPSHSHRLTHPLSHTAMLIQGVAWRCVAGPSMADGRIERIAFGRNAAHLVIRGALCVSGVPTQGGPPLHPWGPASGKSGWYLVGVSICP